MPYKTNKDLPDPIKKALPEAAQNIYRGAFNGSAAQNMAEKQSHAIAWAAVKRKYKKEGEEWIAKNDAEYRDSIEEFQMTEMVPFGDASSMYETEAGYLTASPRVSRTGVQLYRGWEVGVPDTETVRVYRPEAEVFEADAMASLAYRPITNDHPPTDVKATNWREYSVGISSGDIARDGDCIRVPLVVMDGATVKAVKDGKRQLSVGYKALIKWGDGITGTGEKYDAVQTQIRANHIAIVDKARGGARLKLGDDRPDDTTKPPRERKKAMRTILIDGFNVDVEDDRDAQMIERRIKTLETGLADSIKMLKDNETNIVTLQSTMQAKDAKIATLEKQLTDATISPQRLDDMVKERQALIEQAHKMLGDALIVNGRTDADIRRQVVQANLGASFNTSWNDEAVATSFATLAVTQKGGNNSGHGNNANDAAAAFSRPGFRTAAQEVDKAWADGINAVSDAWKPKYVRDAEKKAKRNAG